jgi:hypothetical protein
MDISLLVAQFLTLAGIGALIAFIVNALKTAGVVKDGTSATWATGFNLIGLVALFILKVFVPSADIGKLDGVAATIAQIGVLVLGLITQMLGSKLAHATASGVWLIGKSFSHRNL